MSSGRDSGAGGTIRFYGATSVANNGEVFDAHTW